MDAIYEELRTAQLTALQNQIVPHYIVNSLDAIRMKLLLDGQTESAELRGCLQTSLKTYGFVPGERISLSEEFAFLEECLKFHRFRFLGRLSWVLHLPAELQSREIPRFLFQPLVENAIRHGLSPDMPNPQVEIKAWLQDDFLFLSVSDNGKGFLESENPYGIGLANVKERLRLLYGDVSAVDVKSVPGSGTCVTLRLPEKGDSYI